MVSKARHSRRGQGALEYLLTHGWALLVLAVVIVILYGVGIFNPNRYVAEECVFQPGFGCATLARLHLASDTAHSTLPDAKFIFGVPLSNNLGYDIAITGMEITSTDFVTSGQYTCTISNLDVFNTILNSDDGCLTWFNVGWNGNSYTEPQYPMLLLNGETKDFNLVFKSKISTGVAVGEVRELKFKITYRNCNTDIAPNHGWARGSPSSTDMLTLYSDCTAPTTSTSEHVLSGKIISRVGSMIITNIVTQ